LIDSSQASIDKGLKFADKLLEKDVGKGRISQEDAAAARERLSSSTKLEDLSDVDFVIEAVPVRPPVSVAHRHAHRTRRKFQI
jgi:3-hydroxybutyryl-CoA dehydrogenase